MLDLVQQALEFAGFSVARIDGQKSLQDRARAISRFTDDSACTVMLASIGSAGEGYVTFSPSASDVIPPSSD
jgi:SNF2 family DNA or RNA helicase